ncbi:MULTISPECIES: hypothetical protein [Methylobacterium]|uniref:Class I SAM-dependent methyltransferase n=3 Tax=Pseudomonadota TaxID=1224 RepID=A0ABQ4SU72_9HYPH|nr:MULTISPECIES: hypothetical protein [Methylobacterium]PIU07020.1 MAG: hypothetical protein COT56_06385 [Methylobacterium sp. CG09_land_8_20_14_0_10_71_15]PIU14324.1 MAG: hypothetical protein COT28_08325 [Methylobacterium sp. CG08_land_8_20_14_0_20_71_15]GBU16704.1 hypothetical protein AwMethylo_09190 [Methylobacterium sp.]GJE05435.1 hypothetical protein AOPFMNJM_0735 [Methylobacterium jeotgali]
MLADLFHILTTPAPAAMRRLGYVAESVALRSRSRRCRRAWAPHLERTRSVILAASDGLPHRRTVAVLGSGLLDDVPVKGLAERFERVLLVDAVHPWATRLAVRRWANVRLVHADLSGAAELLLGKSSSLSDPLAVLRGETDLDLVVSANLLSQLPILPLDACERPGGPRRPDLGREIVAAHLAALSSLEARVCLVTDVSETELDREGRVTDRLDLMHGVPMPEPDQVWDWELAPFGEVARHRRILHRVHAYPDWTRRVPA